MESGFQFTNPSLKELKFQINEKFNRNNEEININIGMSVSVNRKEKSNEAKVALDLILGEMSEDTPFYVHAIEEANFRWDESVNDELVEVLLNQNAPSLLLSYLRPIVSQVTSSSSFDAFDIPFMNFQK